MIAVGARRVGRVLREEFETLDLKGPLLDVGGGTGLLRAVLPSAVRHVCLDIDWLKLTGFLRRYPGGTALHADATSLPVSGGVVDAVVCAFIAHHLDDASVDRMIEEGHRVLKPGGRFVLIDPLWAPRRPIGRLLWRYDRGRHPRAFDAHRASVARRFSVIGERRFAFLHAYGMVIGQKAVSPSDQSAPSRTWVRPVPPGRLESRFR